jgi:methylglutaconyl-CoA hydratase
LLHELRINIGSISAEYDINGDEIPAPKRFGGAAGEDHKGPTRTLILASEVDSCFCAGADLKERAGFSADETAAFLSNLRSTFAALASLPIPTISAVSSLALGGGLELALCTHLRVFASTAQVGLPETRLGIIPGAGGTYRLPALIGLSRARDLILTGRRVSAAEAYFLGIADRLVEVVDEKRDEGGEAKKDLMSRAKDEVLKEAVVLAGQICEGGPVAVRSALKAVGYAREEVENEMYERVVGTEDRNEALAAFREKRMPTFQGK